MRELIYTHSLNLYSKVNEKKNSEIEDEIKMSKSIEENKYKVR